MSEPTDLPPADQAGAAGESAPQVAAAEDAPSHHDEAAADGSAITRRQMLARSVAVMGGAIAAGIGVPAVVYIAGPAAEDAGTSEWIRLGPVGAVEPGEPTLMKTTVERRSGYLTSSEELSVFVTTPNGSDFTALSNVCTHLGCRVRWVADQNGFFCPCHNAIFNADGSVATGPPPRALDEFETKVEESQIYIRELG